MYGLEPRDNLIINKTATSDAVGPGAYQADKGKYPILERRIRSKKAPAFM